MILDGTGTCATENTACDVCASGCRYATLQAAVDAAAAGDTIRLCAGTYDGAEITTDVTIKGVGNGDGGTIVTRTSTAITAAAATGRIILIPPERTVELHDLHISGGPDGGGGIQNAGRLTVDGVTVSDNKATDSGGGIFNLIGATLALLNSLVTRNSTLSPSSDGGGIFNQPNVLLTIINSIVEHNTSTRDGGGIYNDSNVQVTLTDSSIDVNTATRDGGGIYTGAGSVVTSTRTRVNNNSSGGRGGGIFNTGGTITGFNQGDIDGNTPTNCGGDSVSGCQ